jgi:hypothetical protein
MINEELQSAYNAGTLVVYAAGDNNDVTVSSTCNLVYPANRTEVLSVNGLASVYNDGHSNPVILPNPTLSGKAWSTSGYPVNVYNGSGYAAQTDSSLGPAGPGNIGQAYDGLSGYIKGGLGSSFTAPLVAGAAGLLRDAWAELGYGVRPNYWLKTDLLMLTDGYSFTDYNDGTGRLVGGISKFSGPGRLKLRTPVRDFPSGPWQWSWGDLSLSNHGTWTKTVPANIQNYRFAMFWQEVDQAHAADIDVQVDAINSSGVSCGTIALQTDYSNTNVLHIKRSDIPSCALSGGSLKVTVFAYAVPSGQTRLVHLSDLWDSESTY